MDMNTQGLPNSQAVIYDRIKKILAGRAAPMMFLTKWLSLIAAASYVFIVEDINNLYAIVASVVAIVMLLNFIINHYNSRHLSKNYRYYNYALYIIVGGCFSLMSFWVFSSVINEYYTAVTQPKGNSIDPTAKDPRIIFGSLAIIPVAIVTVFSGYDVESQFAKLEKLQKAEKQPPLIQ